MRGFRGVFAALVAGLALAAGAARAEAVPHTDKVLGGSTVRLYQHAFLSAEELATLQVVQTNADALAIFMPPQAKASGGHAAMALSPEEGLIRDGQAVASAVAISGLADAATAEAEALAGCNKARKARKPCVIVLTVAPGQ